jgi:hypothetical protein
LALFTKGVETAGFIAGAHLLVARERRPHSPAERNVRWIPDLRSARFRSS